MHRKIAGLFFATSVAFVALAGSASAQNSPGIAALDTALRGAVERKDVPGIVALVTDRKGVDYQGASAWPTCRADARSRPTRCSALRR